jgi:hypothetical protein
VLLVWLVHAIVGNAFYYSLWVGVVGALLGGILSAAKLVPAIVYVQTFPRPGQLVLFDTVFRLLFKLAIGLFLPFLLKGEGRHESEYGVGIIPPIFTALALSVAIQRHQLTIFAKRLVKTWPYLVGFFLVCLIPIAVNFGGLGFDIVLKRVPYINNNVTLIRWFWIYIPVLCVVTGALLDYLMRASLERRVTLAISALVTVIIATATNHRFYFDDQTYDPSSIIAANASLDRGKPPPKIVEIGSGRDQFDNDGLVNGVSAYPCYEPLFGYFLETFPPGIDLGHLGLHGTGRLRNPACFIYGAANRCLPGEAFSDSEQAAMFAQYRSFRYVTPTWQTIADLLSAFGFLLVLVLPIYAVVRVAVRRFRRRYAEGQCS